MEAEQLADRKVPVIAYDISKMTMLACQGVATRRVFGGGKNTYGTIAWAPVLWLVASAKLKFYMTHDGLKGPIVIAGK